MRTPSLVARFLTQRFPLSLRPSRREGVLRLLVVVAVIGVIIAAILLRERLVLVRAVSYPGIFLLSFLGSASIVVPVPGLASVCAGGALLALNPLLLAVVAGMAESLGEMTGYGAGYAGRAFLEGRPLAHRLSAWVRRKGGPVLFLFSLIPNPFFDIIGIAAGSLRYPLHLFLPIVFLGKSLKDLGIIYACILGLEVVIDLLRGLF